MMSANEFFDTEPEPGWLVDACGGEVVNPVTDYALFYGASSSSSTSYLDFSHGPSSTAFVDVNLHNHVGPSNASVSRMDLDVLVQPSGGLMQHARQMEQFQPAAPPAPILEIRGPVRSVAPSIEPTTGKSLSAPVSDFVLRAWKKRKRWHA